MRLAHSAKSLVAGGFALSAACIAVASCAGDGSVRGFVNGDAPDATPSFGEDASNIEGCVNLQCQRVDCGAAPKTSIHGVVVTPSWHRPDPLYNAVVYIPNEKVEPFAPGVACDQCGAITSGAPVAAAVSAADGSFTLNDVPVGKDIPLVVQIGRWRRQVTIPSVDACKVNVLDRELTRLPRNRGQGDIPRIALATGSVDPIECVLRKIGIDDSEFSAPSGVGRVHLYQQNGAVLTGSGARGQDLWSDLEKLKTYDMVLLPCEGGVFPKSLAATQNMIDYTTLGGRMMTSHYGAVWIADAPAPFPTTADWTPDSKQVEGPLLTKIDRSFPKGEALAAWLVATGASNVLGQVSLDNPRHDVGMPRNGTQGWMYAASDATALLHLTFNTPVGKSADQQCGRVVYSDFHVASRESFPADVFPTECDSTPMTSSERMLEFMLFDLATCIQDGNEYPKPPPSR